MKIDNAKRILARFIHILLLSSFSACSVAPIASEMIPEDLRFGKRHPDSVSLEIMGDENDIATGTLVSASDLEAAIEISITKSGMFTEVVQGGAGKYLLKVDADVNYTGTPSVIATFGGTWVLVDSASGEIIADKFIRENYEATFSDAAIGFARVRLALAGAARKFIEEGMKYLATLDL